MPFLSEVEPLRLDPPSQPRWKLYVIDCSEVIVLSCLPLRLRFVKMHPHSAGFNSSFQHNSRLDTSRRLSLCTQRSYKQDLPLQESHTTLHVVEITVPKGIGGRESIFAQIVTVLAYSPAESLASNAL